jgi:hypothetical protein
MPAGDSLVYDKKKFVGKQKKTDPRMRVGWYEEVVLSFLYVGGGEIFTACSILQSKH